MNYTGYAEFCRRIGYRVMETPGGIWIGPSFGFFNRMPLYETTPPTREEMLALFRHYPIVGLNYASSPDGYSKISHNYFIRNRNYGLDTLDKKGRWSVKKGLANCHVRPMEFDELYRLGMPLNRDSLTRQGRTDPMFTNDDQWRCLCQAGKRVEEVEAWGAFVGEAIAAYLILIRLGPVVSLLYSSSQNSLLNFHPCPALFFSVVQAMMQKPGVEAIYNGPEWFGSGEGLDRFKQRLGFVPEPVAFIPRFRPLLSRILRRQKIRHAVSFIGPCLLNVNDDCHQRIEQVLDLAFTKPPHTPPSFQAGDMVRVRSRQEIEKKLGNLGKLHGCMFMDEMWSYCGTVQQILKPLMKYVDRSDYKIRECHGVYLLKGVMCQGSQFPGGCDYSCFFFWREEWLKKIEETHPPL